ncbi:MAG TPA: photosynthetic complex putative assembly protein PuhB [Rubrivivax sp.]|nr:photosynthetic complex putative assembly protein PuhB [Rubrivivax sp.]
MKPAHRHSASGHEHEFEAQPGLPEALPSGERLLWQGSPQWRTLARRAFHVRKLMVYFAAMALLRVFFVFSDTGSGWAALRASIGPLAVTALALGLVLLMAWLSARSTVYTLTDKRVVMRIGIVLTLTFNIPLKRIAGAGLHLDADGTGDLPLTLLPPDRIAWLHLWPHARPWRLGRPEPMLRSVPQAAMVARLLSQAWSQATGQSAASAEAHDSAAPVRPATASGGASGQPALAGR